MLKNIKKTDWKTLGIITIIVMIICNAFLQMHYSSDTFVLFNLGYMQYPFEYFLLDGRLISTLVCWAAGLLHIPYKSYIIGMDVIAIILVSFTIYTVYKTIEKILNPDKNSKKLFIFMSSFVLILNQFSLEYLLFPESAVMCLGQLLCIIASTKVIYCNKYKYLKISILLFFAIFCYQGLVNIFPILAILFIFLKQIKENNSFKKNIIELVKKTSILFLICVILISINIVTIKICCNILNNSSNRTIQLIDFESVILRFKTILTYLDMIWNKSLDMLPKHINSIIVILTLILLAINKVKKEIFTKYIFTILAALIICIIPMFFLNTGPCGRVNVPICQIWGISLLFLITSIDNKSDIKTYKLNIIYAFILISFILNSIMVIRNTSEHIAANRVDENMGLTIKLMLEEYEKESGNKITKFAYIYDSDPQQYAPNIKHIGSLTERKLACSWCISEAINFYCDRNLEKVRMPIKIYTENFIYKDYTCFSEEQILFSNDTMYLCVY